MDKKAYKAEEKKEKKYVKADVKKHELAAKVKVKIKSDLPIKVK